MGIIPADAGSTFVAEEFYGLHADHPRGCGEHRKGTGFEIGCRGSSPRMRGAHHDHAEKRPCPGIIPADAGSTVLKSPIGHSIKDHPRGCGEH